MKLITSIPAPARHQHPITSIPCWCWYAGHQHAGREHLCLSPVQSAFWFATPVRWMAYLIWFSQIRAQNRSNYFGYIKNFNLWEKWEQNTKCCIYMFVYLVQYLQFVSGALKWPQNLAGLKLVFSKLGVLWHLTDSVSVLSFHSQLQYEISCRHIPCWSPAYQHQNTIHAGFVGHQLCWSTLVFPAGHHCSY